MKQIKLFIYLVFVICSVPAAASAGETFRDPGPGLLSSPRMPMGLPLHWQRVTALMPRQADILAACGARPEACPSKRILTWLEALESYRHLAPRAQLARVNACSE